MGNNTVKAKSYNYQLIPLVSDLDKYTATFKIRKYTQAISFPIIGNASEFPFDLYSLDLRFVTPFNYSLVSKNYYDKSINSSLITSIPDASMIKQIVNCRFSNSSLCFMHKPGYFPSIKNDSIFWLIHFDFKRNYTVDAITIPILAIFYLLGAIFILESTMDQLTIRLAITLGIFAFLFTFTPIINQMKPPSIVAKVPTIADSLVTVILVATIAFSVSSVISGGPVIRNKFPRGSIWIDRIVFFFVSGVIIWYFRNYSLDITIWIVPVIIFGLGYGLLLRTSGLKIAETLEKVFKKGVKRLPT